MRQARGHKAGSMPTHAVTILAVLVAVARPLAARAEETFTTIDVHPDGGLTRVWGTNPIGNIYVGHYRDAAFVTHGFRLRTSNGDLRTIDVPFPDATSTVARGINKRGDIVGRYGLPNGTVSGWLLENEEDFTLIEVPGSTRTLAHGINNAGDIVGAYGAVGEEHGFLRRDNEFFTIDVPGSVFTILRAITDVGDMVGWFGTPDGVPHGFVWRAGGLDQIDFPNATETQAAAINANGDIVGRFIASDDTHGFLYRNGNFQRIDFPEAVNTEASGIADNGDIVGFYALEGTLRHRMRGLPNNHGYLLRGLYKGRKTQ